MWFGRDVGVDKDDREEEEEERGADEEEEKEEEEEEEEEDEEEEEEEESTPSTKLFISANHILANTRRARVCKLDEQRLSSPVYTTLSNKGVQTDLSILNLLFRTQCSVALRDRKNPFSFRSLVYVWKKERC